ncbi:MAG TPA: bacteriocin [Candidatus Ornithoclostridium faecavium]|nr:bacteriocin [Candidatus Ornithoclostridium faecavium]
MWESVIDTVVANGAWAVLFCLLLIFELKDSRKREEKYQETIFTLGEDLGVVREVADDVKEIKRDLRRVSDSCGNEEGETEETSPAAA